MRTLFTYQIREKAINNIYFMCNNQPSTTKDHIIIWIKKTMDPGTWYPIQKNNIDLIKSMYSELLNNYDIEVTFNKKQTKIKITKWVDGKPLFNCKELKL